MRRLALGAAAAAAAFAGFTLAGCGGDGSPPTTTAPPTTAPPPPSTTTATSTASATTALEVYLLRDGKVAAARRDVPETKAVATAALDALLAGPTGAEGSAGLSSAVAASNRFHGLAIDGSVARVSFDSDLSHAAEAQVVYTLTQFATVKAVELGGRRLTRESFEDVTPAILVESPVVGDTVSSPLRIRGTANTFEATFVVELLLHAAGQKAFRQVVTATSGSGQRGTFDVTITFQVNRGGPATLVAYEESAENGQPIHRVEIPVTIGP